MKSSLRSRRLEVVGERENGRARGDTRVSFSRAHFFLCPLLPSATTSKRLLRRLREILVKWYKLTFVVDRKPGYVHTNTDIFDTAHIFTRIFTRQGNRRRNITMQSSVADPGGGGGGESGIPPISNLTLVWDWNSYIGRIVYHFLTGWFFFNETRVAFCD